MCGNGVRCVAKYIYDHDICRVPTLKIETGRGVLTLDLEVENERVNRVRVDMGEPILEASRIPTTLQGERVIDQPVPWAADDPTYAWSKSCGFDPRMTCVSMGNPHVVLYCKDVAKVPLAAVGPVMENWDAWPRRINIHFVQVHSTREVTMRTWEARQRDYAGLRHGCKRCVRGWRTDQAHGPKNTGAPAGWRLGTGMER